MLKSSTLRPGLLVSLSTTIKGGNVRYAKRTVEGAHTVEGGAIKESWETEKLVRNPEELEAGKVARGKARQAIIRHCSWSAFGLLCPTANKDELEAGIKEAREIAETFNATATDSRLGVYTITGQIADNDAEALRAINSELTELLTAMETGVQTLDAKTIRDAAARAVGLGQMLSPEAEARMKVAVDAARKAARTIVKAGESAAIEVDRVAIRRIQESRLAFLDMDEGETVQTPQASARAVDFEPEAPTLAKEAASYSGRALDMDDGNQSSPILARTMAQAALIF